MELVIALAILAIAVWFVSSPLRRSGANGGEAVGGEEDPVIADLEARKEAKYREIRDAELDRRQGKLSASDWKRQDAELRREAIEILRELDQARGERATS